MPYVLSALRTLVLIGVFAAPMSAQTSGTYQLVGGTYTIRVEALGDTLTVIEPNKRSRYGQRRPDVFGHYTPATRAWHYLQVMDPQTLKAWREPNAGAGPPSILKLQGAPAASAARSANADYAAIAERYRFLAEGDPDNVQAWTFCAAAANAFATKTELEAEQYAWKVAQQLKPIATNPAASPCKDVVSQANWTSASAPTSVSSAASSSRPSVATPSAAPASAPTVADSARQAFQEGMKQKLAEQVASGDLSARDARIVADVAKGADIAADIMSDMSANRARKRTMAEAAEARAARLTNSADVQGFAVPVRPAFGTMIFPEFKGVIEHFGFVMTNQDVPSPFGTSGASGKPEGLATNKGFYHESTKKLAPVLAAGGMKWLQFQFKIVFPKQPTNGGSTFVCEHFGAGGESLGITQSRGFFRAKKEKAMYVHSRIVLPRDAQGIYGIECRSLNKPFVNATVDVI